MVSIIVRLPSKKERLKSELLKKEREANGDVSKHRGKRLFYRTKRMFFESKTCPHCNIEKTMGEYYFNEYSQKFASWCNDCEKGRYKKSDGSKKRGRPVVEARDVDHANKRKRARKHYIIQKERKAAQKELIVYGKLNGLGWRKKWKEDKKHYWLIDTETLCGRIERSSFNTDSYELDITDELMCKICNRIIYNARRDNNNIKT